MAGPDGAERLTDPLAQAARQAVDRRHQPPVVLGGLAQRHQLAPVGGEETRRKHVSLSHGVDLTGHDGIGPLARCDLPREARRQRPCGVALHPGERLSDGATAQQGHQARLGQIDSERLGQGRAQARVRGPVLEVGHDEAGFRGQLTPGHQRADRPDAEEAHRGPPDGGQAQRRERQDAAQHGLAPGEQAAETAGGRGRDPSAGTRQRATALEVAREQDDREREHEQQHCAGEHPVRQAEEV